MKKHKLNILMILLNCVGTEIVDFNLSSSACKQSQVVVNHVC